MKKIIIVDDSKEFRNALRETLNEIGGNEIIGEASHGSELIRVIRHQKPDIIFMDIEMPYINGFEATESVLAIYPEVKIVGLSSFEKEHFIYKLIDVGAIGYMLKAADNFETIKALLNDDYEDFIYSPEINNHIPLLKTNKIILFVDENNDSHLELRHELRKFGFKVSKAHNITESTYFLINDKIDVIVINDIIIEHNKSFLNNIIKTNNNPDLIIFILKDHFNTDDKIEAEPNDIYIKNVNRKIALDKIIEKLNV